MDEPLKATHSLPTIPAQARQRIVLDLKNNITRDSLHDILDRILKHAGCTACGLVGFDIQLSGDDLLSRELSDIGGIRSVRVERG